jgi:hypothetical protein
MIMKSMGVLSLLEREALSDRTLIWLPLLSLTHLLSIFSLTSPTSFLKQRIKFGLSHSLFHSRLSSFPLHRMAIIYGEASSSPSPWTSVFKTRPLVAPSPPDGPLVAIPSAEFPTHAFLSFPKPLDDGGVPILGCDPLRLTTSLVHLPSPHLISLRYHVFARSTEEHHHTEWTWNGIYHNGSATASSPVGHALDRISSSHSPGGHSRIEEFAPRHSLRIPCCGHKRDRQLNCLSDLQYPPHCHTGLMVSLLSP